MYKKGEFYQASNVKIELQKVYNDKKLDRKAKATDLYEFFEVNSCSKRIDNVKVKGFEIIRVK